MITCFSGTLPPLFLWQLETISAVPLLPPHPSCSWLGSSTCSCVLPFIQVKNILFPLHSTVVLHNEWSQQSRWQTQPLQICNYALKRSLHTDKASAVLLSTTNRSPPIFGTCRAQALCSASSPSAMAIQTPLILAWGLLPHLTSSTQVTFLPASPPDLCVCCIPPSLLPSFLPEKIKHIKRESFCFSFFLPHSLFCLTIQLSELNGFRLLEGLEWKATSPRADGWAGHHEWVSRCTIIMILGACGCGAAGHLCFQPQAFGHQKCCTTESQM